MELYFAFLKLETAFLAAQDLYRACSELVSAMKDPQGGPPGRESNSLRLQVFTFV